MNGETALVQSQSAAVEVLDVSGKLSPDIIARAAAIYGSVGPVRQEDGKQVGITKAEALRAALYLADNPGETLGRDVYLSTQGKTRGQLMEGYRAVQDRITQRFGVKYRGLTPEELEMHDVPRGKKSLIAEVTVYADKMAADAAGVEYQPIIGITVQDPPSQIPAGKTLRWVLEKNARKDALRQMVGMPVDADEAIADLDAAGTDVSELRQLRAEGKRFTAEQAVEMVKQNQRAEATIANFRAMTPEEQQATLKRNTDAMRAPAGFEGFGDEPRNGSKARESHGPNWDDLQGGGTAGAKAAQEAATKAEQPAKPHNVKAKLVGGGFNDALMALIEKLDSGDVPHPYRKPDGGIDYDHAQYTAGAEGFTEITRANMADVIAAIERHVMAKAGAPA